MSTKNLLVLSLFILLAPTQAPAFFGLKVGPGKVGYEYYVGELHKGSPQGLGYNQGGSGEYVGKFYNGAEIGIGRVRYGDGTTMIGTFKGYKYQSGPRFVQGGEKANGFFHIRYATKTFLGYLNTPLKYDGSPRAQRGLIYDSATREIYAGDVRGGTQPGPTSKGRGILYTRSGVRFEAAIDNWAGYFDGDQSSTQFLLHGGRFYNPGKFGRSTRQRTSDYTPPYSPRWGRRYHPSYNKKSPYQDYSFSSDPAAVEGIARPVPQVAAKIDREAGILYHGEMRGNAFDGFGELRKSDGSIYTGWFKKGKRHGYGKLVTLDGSIRVGEFAGDALHGVVVRSTWSVSPAWKANTGADWDPLAPRDAFFDFPEIARLDQIFDAIDAFGREYRRLSTSGEKADKKRAKEMLAQWKRDDGPLPAAEGTTLDGEIQSLYNSLKHRGKALDQKLRSAKILVDFSIAPSELEIWKEGTLQESVSLDAWKPCAVGVKLPATRLRNRYGELLVPPELCVAGKAALQGLRAVSDDGLVAIEGGRSTCFDPSCRESWGEWKDGELHGTGTVLVGGLRYEGEFKAGKRHGRGVRRSDTNRYEGEFSEGRELGKGTLYLGSRDETRIGTWSGSCLLGKAKVIRHKDEIVEWGTFGQGPYGCGMRIDKAGAEREKLFAEAAIRRSKAQEAAIEREGRRLRERQARQAEDKRWKQERERERQAKKRSEREDRERREARSRASSASSSSSNESSYNLLEEMKKSSDRRTADMRGIVDSTRRAFDQSRAAQERQRRRAERESERQRTASGTSNGGGRPSTSETSRVTCYEVTSPMSDKKNLIKRRGGPPNHWSGPEWLTYYCSFKRSSGPGKYEWYIEPAHRALWKGRLSWQRGTPPSCRKIGSLLYESPGEYREKNPHPGGFKHCFWDRREAERYRGR